VARDTRGAAQSARNEHDARHDARGAGRRMRLSLTATSLLAAFALVGCGDDDARTPSGPPVAVDDFCPEFVDAICDAVVRCDCSPTADADCRADLAETCDGDNGFLGATTRARIDSGKVRYDAAAAGAVIAKLRGVSTCDNPLLALRWTFTDVLTFEGVFRGTVAPGGACTTTSTPIGGECANGICQETMGGGVCIGFAGLGASCGMGMPTLCANLSVPFTSFDNPDFLLRCDIPMGATTGTCAARLANGGTCGSDSECQSDRCDMNICSQKLANGAMCMGDDECDSGFCQSDATGQTCATRGAGAAVGASCTGASDCESDECRDGVCVAGVCGLYDPPAPPPS
jgi:hypothetical protein